MVTLGAIFPEIWDCLLFGVRWLFRYRYIRHRGCAIYPNKTAPESLSGKINKYLENNENLKLKSHPINCHGLLTSKVEDIPQQALYEFLDLALDAIKDTYYKD